MALITLNKVHEILYDQFNIPIIREGQQLPPGMYPYVSYVLINDDRYTGYQVMSSTFDSESEGTGIEYKAPTYQTYQYSICSNDDSIENSLNRINDFYNFFLTNAFKIAIKRHNITADIVSPITEINEIKDKFFERQFMFEVRYGYSNNFIENTEEFIESTNYTMSPGEE